MKGKMKKKTKSPRVQIKELKQQISSLRFDKDYFSRKVTDLTGEVTKYKRGSEDKRKERLLDSMARIVDANAHLTMYVSKIVAKETW